MVLGDNMRGALLMTAGMAAFTVNDAFMKLLSAEMELFQALFLRGLGTTAAFFAIAHWFGALRFSIAPRDRFLIAMRMMAEIGAAYFFLTALFNMPLANATAILQSLPLVITLAGALFLGEALGWRRLLAISAGFVGVLLIVRPGTEGFNFYSVMALVSVLCVTLRDLATRRLSSQVPSLSVALTTAGGVTLFFGFASVTSDWVVPSVAGAGQLVGATLCIIAGYLLSVMAVRVGDLGFVMPYRYTSLLWALLLGLFVFGDWPSPLTMLGAAIIVATGLFTFHRERRLRLTGAHPALPTPTAVPPVRSSDAPDRGAGR
jgi:drug/metabolite transporter (DMT)-like permease